MKGKDNIKMAIHNIGGTKIASEKLNVSTSAISKWIRQGKIPNWNLANAVAQASGFIIDELRPTYQNGVLI